MDSASSMAIYWLRHRVPVPITGRMKKLRKKPKPGLDESNTEVVVSDELHKKTEYQEYVKEHARRMRELERQASGRNMTEPN